MKKKFHMKLKIFDIYHYNHGLGNEVIGNEILYNL